MIHPQPLTRERQDIDYAPLIDAVRNNAPKDYSDRFAFHLFEHVLGVEKRSVANLTRLEYEGVSGLPSQFMMRFSALLHDAGLPRFFGLGVNAELPQTNFDCPESLSMQIASGDAEAYGIDKFTTEEINESIWATKAGVRARTWGGFILCLSDIQLAGDDFDEVFLLDGEKLRQEKIMTKGHTTIEEYQDFTVWLMSKYIVENLHGAENFSQDINPVDYFAPEIDRIAANVTQLATLRAAQRGLSLEAYSHDGFLQAPETCVPALLGFAEAN